MHRTHLDGFQDDTAARTLYFVDELLSDLRFPASALGSRKGSTRYQKAGVRQAEAVIVFTSTGAPGSGPDICTDETSGTIRLVTTPTSAVTRNRLGLFAGTHVAMELTVLWGGQAAIAGHVVKLESFHPETSVVALSRPSTINATVPVKPSTNVIGKVIAGQRISGAQLV